MRWVKIDEAKFDEFLNIPGLKSKTNGVFCVNIIIGDCKKRDIITIFDPDKHTRFVRITQETDWAQLLKALGIFSSVSRARKNGWNRSIDLGFSAELVSRKQNKAIFIFKQPDSSWRKFTQWVRGTKLCGRFAVSKYY
jgi:hypothetical protein